MAWAEKESISAAPAWCSVDLRDGNRALSMPMSLEEKLEFFAMLVRIGFKEIEVGVPGSSEADYLFLRTLIEQGLIPQDVTVQALTPPNEQIIRRTFHALEGTSSAIIHTYNTTYVDHREQFSRAGREHLLDLAKESACLLRDLSLRSQGEIRFEFSPVNFHSTEMDFALEICNAVIDIWKPTPSRKAIINLLAAIELSMSHVFASQVEYMSSHLHRRDGVILSVHAHNDRGCAVSASEMSVLAGAERIEGTLFGNGERTGNADIITLALNLYTHGVDPGLDFSNIMEIRKAYTRMTGMTVPERQPYTGEFVFSTFSDSYKKAIAKGMLWQDLHKQEGWIVPYLPIDPADIGRTYDADAIRSINLSCMGGISYILKKKFSVCLPEKMREEVFYTIKQFSDEKQENMTAQNVFDIFAEKYLLFTPYFSMPEFHFRLADGIMAEAVIAHDGKKTLVRASGNGGLDAISNIIKQYFGISYELTAYEEHALSRGSSSKAMAFVGILNDGTLYWGAGTDEDIISASIKALVVAVNKLPQVQKQSLSPDDRLMAMQNYIQANYQTVTLESLAAQFHLSAPYVSKYIHEKSGHTFGELVTSVRLKRAKTLLKNGNMTVENISYSVGYPNVEHFTRVFKKNVGLTPMQFRNINKHAL